MPVRDSPFPGMDPYLQRRWDNVHATLVPLIQEALQPTLPPGLRARAEQRILLEDDQGEPTNQWYRPDVAIVTAPPPPAGPGRPGPMPDENVVVVELSAEPAVDRWVQIIDTRAGNRVVTAIEVLSPANKRAGPLNRLYRRKLRDYARGAVSVVEVDLLIGSRARLAVTRDRLPRGRRTPYLIAVRWAPIVEQWRCHPVSIRDPIPAVPVPLRPGDDEVRLDLQPLVARTYRAGGHDDIDYGRDPDPPLRPSDAAWADGLLRADGRR